MLMPDLGSMGWDHGASYTAIVIAFWFNEIPLADSPSPWEVSLHVLKK